MEKKKAYNFMPIAIDISGRRIIIIGGGRVGCHKAQLLTRYTSEATVISKTFDEGFSRLPFTCVEKAYEPSDLDGAWLVYICTEDHSLNARIKEDARRRGILASVCDAPDLCDFVSPAIYKDGDLSVAVSSNARDVHRSIRVRNAIRQAAGEGTLDTE